MISNLKVGLKMQQYKEKLKFYQFHQNNVDGEFHVNMEKGIGHHIIIQESNAYLANKKMESLGIVFEKNKFNVRWHETDEPMGDDEIMLYNKPIEDFINKEYMSVIVYAHYKNAGFRSYRYKRKKYSDIDIVTKYLNSLGIQDNRVSNFV